MASKQEYKKQNEEFLVEVAKHNGVKTLSQGILYEVLNEGEGDGATSKILAFRRLRYMPAGKIQQA